MSQLPLVTIQIPTYNQKDYIVEAVASALAQTYEHLQIVVSDDGTPSYDIFEVLKDYIQHPKIQIHRNARNLGRVANYRFTLYNLVEGEWFMNLDGDDYLINPDFITNAITAILKVKDKEVVMYKGNTVIPNVLASGIKYTDLGNDAWLVSNTDFLDNLKYDFGFSHGYQLYNTSKAMEVDFYNRDLLDADYFSYLKIMRSGNIIMSPEKVYHWRQHDAQETHSVTTAHVLARFDAVEELRVVWRPLGKCGHDAAEYTRLVVYYYLLRVASMRKTLWSDMPKILKKTKGSKAYIVPLLSAIKRYYIKRKA